MLEFLVQEGICSEDAECNLRGDLKIGIMFEKKNALNFVKR